MLSVALQSFRKIIRTKSHRLYLKRSSSQGSAQASVTSNMYGIHSVSKKMPTLNHSTPTKSQFLRCFTCPRCIFRARQTSYPVSSDHASLPACQPPVQAFFRPLRTSLVEANAPHQRATFACSLSHAHTLTALPRILLWAWASRRASSCGAC
jgi:hypothetical protein